MIKERTVIKVGISDLNIVTSPHSIRTSGLGSCVGLVLFDSFTKIGGLAHIMLPSSEMAKSGLLNEAKYADTSIRKLISLLKEAGAAEHRLKAKLAGGAQMFQFASGSETMRIGKRNVDAVKLELAERKIPIIAEDTGGNSGRTIEFNPETAILTVRTVNQGVSEL